MMDRVKGIGRRLERRARRFWAGLPTRVQRVTPYVVVLLAGLVIGSTLFSRVTAPAGDGVDGIRAAQGDLDEGDGIEWTCSMHPQVRQPGPGSCPICGMDLIPVSTGDDDGVHGELPRLTVSDRAAALMAVQVWPAERRDLASEVRLSGVIGYDETRVSDAILRTDGQVERLYVNYEQAAVGRGQLVADIYSPAILAASQELLQARRAAERGGMAELVEAAAAQLISLGVTRAGIDRILESGEPARTYALHSPGAGVVTELSGRQGEWLMAGSRLMRVAGLDRVWAQFEAYERDLARLRVGQTMQFTVESFPGRAFVGTIAFIDPVVDGGRRTARVRVQVDNPGGLLKPGMLVRGQAAWAGPGGAAGSNGVSPAPLVIPATAPLVTGQRSLVYVQLPGFDRPTFEPREVTLGARSGAFWEVRDGLAEGDLVVANGAFRIDSELQIRGRASMMNGAQPPSPAGPAVHDHGQQLRDGRRVPVELSAAAGRQLGAVVDAYLDVAGALSRDDPAATRAAARALEAALSTARLAGLEGDAAGEWSRIRRDLGSHAAAMAAAGDLAGLRRELLPVSQLVELAVRSFSSEHVGTLFRATCPMVDGAAGSWLTRVQRIENPYHGADMFGCGTVEAQVTG